MQPADSIRQCVYLTCTCIYCATCILGRHNCLWCEIRADKLKIPRSERGLSKKRSLATLENDYAGFMAAGGDIRQAKNHNNVINPYLFAIPLNQVRIV